MNLKNNPTLKSSKIRVGITIGDPSGIGPAITLKALEILKGQADFTVIGNSFVLAKASKLLKIRSLPLKLIDLNNVDPKNFAFGRLKAQNGRACLEYLDAALGLLKENKIDCLVTCPISKEAINLAGAKFSGHTEYLGKKTGCKDLVMLLLNDKLKFSLVTRHVALKDVCGLLGRKSLENNILRTIKGLRSLFLIKKLKLVVCGVNPHASDNGVIGKEEEKVMIPVIKSLKRKVKGVSIVGPLSADAAISQAAKGNFDCVIAAYHDQALIPLKLTDFDSGVNLTFGLPFVRTSPLHGTAFDIAKKPARAFPGSLVTAIKLAIKCTLNQKKA
ncbi:MAG: 4-hydroxythreonine-4-phosphate dehydrogenase PdxA [Candidatus Omnitrophica bacterium]|nr:4-hydroxythreonine-4-phosphate dehydrogenase PdxA [Candidatus Omnitrophota bacterium]